MGTVNLCSSMLLEAFRSPQNLQVGLFARLDGREFSLHLMRPQGDSLMEVVDFQNTNAELLQSIITWIHDPVWLAACRPVITMLLRQRPHSLAHSHHVCDTALRSLPHQPRVLRTAEKGKSQVYRTIAAPVGTEH